MLSACTQPLAPEAIHAPMGAQNIRALKGGAFEAGIEFSINAPVDSYDALSSLAKQLSMRGFSECAQNRDQLWDVGGRSEQMLVRTYLSAKSEEFAVIRVVQSDRRGKFSTQAFRVAVQRYSPSVENEKKLAEFCGP
jgi:hypothetical protein